MTDYIFSYDDETKIVELMDHIWDAIRYWVEFERKEMVLGRWCDKEGFHVGLTIDERAKISGSLSVDTSKEPREDYELILVKDDDEKRITIPVEFAPTVSMPNYA